MPENTAKHFLHHTKGNPIMTTTTAPTTTDPEMLADFLAGATEQVKEMVSRGHTYDSAIYELTDRNLLDPYNELEPADTAYIIAELTRTLNTFLQCATDDYEEAANEYFEAKVAYKGAEQKMAYAAQMLAKARTEA